MKKAKYVNMLLCAGMMAVCLIGCGQVDASEGEKANESGKLQGTTVQDNESDAGQNTKDDTDVDFSEAAAEGKDTADMKYTQSTQQEEQEEEAVQDIGFSILGDSISTFDGWIPEGFAVFFPLDGEVTDVSQTWWKQVMDETGMQLYTNNSSSGSTCVGDSLSADNPWYGCSDCRITLMAGDQGKMPDIIIVYMGTNDLLMGVPLGDNDGTRLVEEGVVENFTDAYCLILDKLEAYYPTAQIYCCTLAPIGDWGTDQPFVTLVNALELTAEDYSAQIRAIAEKRGIPVIDLANCGIEIDNLHEMTSDGVHLTPEGMKCVKDAVVDAIKIK